MFDEVDDKEAVNEEYDIPKTGDNGATNGASIRGLFATSSCSAKSVGILPSKQVSTNL